MAVDDYNLTGVHQVNKWLWSKLKTMLPADFVAYTTVGSATESLVPIIPSQQLPTFTDIAGGAPFMIYNYSLNPGDEPYMTVDDVGYIIYDNNEARLRRIHNLMVQLLKRMDWTAADINEYLDELATVSKPNEFDFKFVKVTGAPGPQPFETEGGRQASMIMATIVYTHDIQSNPALLGNGLGLRT